MKNKVKYLLYICNVILMGLIVLNIISYKLEIKEISTSTLGIEEGRYISYLKIDNVQKKLDTVIQEQMKENDVEIIEESKKVSSKEEQATVIDNSITKESNESVQESISLEPPKEEPSNENTTATVIETLVGNLAGYGPDCAGCVSMKTASGKYIGEGNIYYNDSTYGKVRILAGDYSYPFGTIVRISNVDFYQDEPFYAVVLDRGGNIGKNKKFLFDLLFATEKEASQLGTEVNIKYEIMRLGY